MSLVRTPYALAKVVTMGDVKKQIESVSSALLLVLHFRQGPSHHLLLLGIQFITISQEDGLEAEAEGDD